MARFDTRNTKNGPRRAFLRPIEHFYRAVMNANEKQQQVVVGAPNHSARNSLMDSSMKIRARLIPGAAGPEKKKNNRLICISVFSPTFVTILRPTWYYRVRRLRFRRIRSTNSIDCLISCYSSKRYCARFQMHPLTANSPFSLEANVSLISYLLSHTRV